MSVHAPEDNTAAGKVEGNPLHPRLTGERLSLVETLEREVSAGSFSAWSYASKTHLASGFFADDIVPPLEGNCDWHGLLHPTFDLASLTKALFTNSLVRMKFKNRQDDLFAPLAEVMREPKTSAGEAIRRHLQTVGSRLSLMDFLNHRSGVPPWTWMGKGLWAFDEKTSSTTAKATLSLEPGKKGQETLVTGLTNHLIQDIATSPQEERYSDIGFFLIARILESLDGEGDSFDWERALNELNTLLGSSFAHASLNPGVSRRAIPFYPYWRLHDQHVPENMSQESGFGLVNDTNANILAKRGVVSGHAGLFGSVLDVLAGATFLAETQRQFSVERRKPQVRFSLGLDTPTSAESTAGIDQFPLPNGREVFGHLGYTGTSFWFELNENQHSATQCLLTNRTACRTSLGCPENTRILVLQERPALTCSDAKISSNSETETHYFAKHPEGNWEEKSRNDIEEIIVASAQSSHLLWDTQTLRTVPNLTSIRREVGRRLWKT